MREIRETNDEVRDLTLKDREEILESLQPLSEEILREILAKSRKQSTLQEEPPSNEFEREIQEAETLQKKELRDSKVPLAMHRELLNLLLEDTIDGTTCERKSGELSVLGPVFLSEHIRRLHGIIERGYDTDDAGDSARGWANQELFTILFEILGIHGTELQDFSLANRIKELKQSNSPSSVIEENRCRISDNALKAAFEYQKHLLVSPWWLESEGNSNPISLPRFLSYGRFTDSSETLFEIGTGNPIDISVAREIDSFFGDSKYYSRVALRGEMVSAEELARLAERNEVQKIAVFMMDGSEQPVILSYDGTRLYKLENKESTLRSHRLTPINTTEWGDSKKSYSTRYMSTIKIALYERTMGSQWAIKRGVMKDDAISKLLTLVTEDSIKNTDNSVLSKCLLRLKLGSNDRANPKRTKFLFESIDCVSLASVLFGNHLHLIEVDRNQSEKPVRALKEREMKGPTRLTSEDATTLLFEFDEVRSKTVDITPQDHIKKNPFGFKFSALSGKVQNLLHRSIAEGKPIVCFEGVEKISERARLANRQHIVQKTDLLNDGTGPDETQSEMIFAFVHIATKRMLQIIENGNTLAETLWKVSGYLRSVNFGVPIRTGHASLFRIPENQHFSLRRRISNTQILTGDTGFQEASMIEVISSTGDSILQMCDVGRKVGFFFLPLDTSNYDFDPSDCSLNSNVLGIQFWLKEIDELEEWMNDSTEFAKLKRNIDELSRITHESYEQDITITINVGDRIQKAGKLVSSIIHHIDEFASKSNRSALDVIDLKTFIDSITEALLLSKNTITTEPERASLSLPYHLDQNGMPIKVPNSICPVSAEHLTAFFSSLGSYSVYSDLLDRIERASLYDERQSIAVGARPANGGSDVLVLSLGSEGHESMYEIENKSYRYTRYQNRYAIRKRMLMRLLNSSGWETKYHTINFVDAQEGLDKHQISYMLEPTISEQERDEILLSEFMKSSLNSYYAILSRIKQVTDAEKDTHTFGIITSRLKEIHAFYEEQFGEEVVWKGEKITREKSIDWSSIGGTVIDQSLLRLSGKSLFASSKFRILQQYPRISKCFELLGWVGKT